MKETKAARRVLQSFDRGELGVSPSSEPGAPAFLKFVAVTFTLASSPRLLDPWVTPQLSAASPLSSSPFGIFRAATGNLRPRPREPASLPQTLTTNRVVDERKSNRRTTSSDSRRPAVCPQSKARRITDLRGPSTIHPALSTDQSTVRSSRDETVTTSATRLVPHSLQERSGQGDSKQNTRVSSE